MANRILTFFIFAFLFLSISGCGSDADMSPRIVGPAEHLRSRPVPVPAVKVDYSVPSYSRSRYPVSWVPSRSRERGWRAIVIHHSAMTSGSMSTIDSYHRNNNGWDGVGYDFVIGNGKGSGDGQVEVTFRWRRQVAGAHCGGTPNNWANESAIGVCLIGDFTKTKPTYLQMMALKRLVRFLQNRYRIPTSRIYGHANTPGYSRGSVCPGSRFPMGSFKASL